MYKGKNTTVETIDREKLLKEATKDLDVFMKISDKIKKIEPNAAIRLRTYFESMVNTQVRAIEREQADAKKAAQAEAVKDLQRISKEEADKNPETRLARLEKALEALGVKI